ncbi:dolichyl-diphosphooligosaccharide--protein glycosyltransferase subunit 1 [Malassezia cuniculi]|uniref:Dolichyl-diphosphooligosaccharide--protein glycosyltransferase subunit 1 n=1 Tax=Malassezia cuniculi TaxID=948313 RepID=A0AAF0EN99_9BASI|nr:dolichyl-diphosphooligosaccharide--protein glycosyltransferase subunit 1 [Malassezia cuniculi]
MRLGAASVVALAACLAQVASASWSHKTLSKHIDLGGTMSMFTLKAQAVPDADDAEYLVYLNDKEHSHLSALNTTISASESVVAAASRVVGPLNDANGTVVYAIDIPESVRGKELAINIIGRVVHVTTPLPRTLRQKENQYLYWEGDAAVRTPYASNQVTLTIKTPTNTISAFGPGGERSGPKITYGPQPGKAHTEKTVVPSTFVHYLYPRPLMTFVDFERTVQLSHIGNTVSTQDNIWLRNDGALLSGFFSRSDYIVAKYMKRKSEYASIIDQFPYFLPARARDVYFIDTIGNVSTSALRPNTEEVPTRLDLLPRYPVMGGWNYTFSVGWKEDLGRVARKVSSGRFSVAVPFISTTKNTAVDHALTRIVLPEGARNIEVFLPFDVDQVRTEHFSTYLDSVGRPAVVVERANCSAAHTLPIFIEYSLSPIDHLRKPAAVAAVVACIYTILSVLRRTQLGVPAKRA